MTEVVDGSEVVDHQRVGAPRCLPQSLYDALWPVAITRRVQLQHRTAGRVGGRETAPIIIMYSRGCTPRTMVGRALSAAALLHRPSGKSVSSDHWVQVRVVLQRSWLRIMRCASFSVELFTRRIFLFLIELLIYGWLISGHPIITGSTC